MASSSHEPFEIPANVKKLTDGVLEFAFLFYREGLTGRAINEINVVLSPIGIAIASGMLHHGAANKTAEELKRILKLDKLENAEDICSGFKYILQSINCSKIRGAKLGTIDLTNRLYIDDTYKCSKAFQQNLRNHYQARIEAIDFSKITKDCLPQGISPDILTEVTGPLSLLNVMSFKCQWYIQFDKTNTRGLFHKSSARTVVTKYMQVKNDFFYVEKNRPDCKFLSLPYGGSGYKMYIILPKDIQGLSAIENTMTRDVFRTLKSSANKTKVDVSIPKFKMNTELVLNQSLKAIGANDLFAAEKADLTLMSDKKPLYLSSFIHSSNVEIDEEGVNAAGVPLTPGQKKSRKMVEFKADHPFMFIIYDERRDFILFMGHLTDPNQ